MSKQYLLEGLCCEKCAAKIEKGINQLGGVQKAAVDPETTILSIDFKPDATADSLFEEIKKIVETNDPDVVIKNGVA
ncbi:MULTISPECIES: heavy-metal-associated domain-containing protein [Acutalibacteraceae]|uniref:heavy-metal-associated domain-containing protein n=1 Tax=Acutalibacteraceae TaxID=3082771 RepID=UPI0013E8DE16|nr:MULTISPECIES: heavy metal-associated domain-containing protein [Acutalibacteraceae]